MSEAVPNTQISSNDQQLAAAYAVFNDTSRQLSKTYQLLQVKVEQLSRELDTVSAQKDQELEKKNQLANRMQALLDFLPGGVIVLDAQGIIVQSNPAAREMLQNPLNDHLWRDLINSCFAPRSEGGLDLITSNGRRVSLATASLDDEGQIILLTDQTETRRLQEQVSRHDKLSAMGKMVSALAHQVRTPLSAAILYANHLCGDTISEERRQEFAYKLLGRLNHMAEQVKDMLLFVRNELPLNEVICLSDLEEGLKAAMDVPLTTSGCQCVWQNAIANESIRCNREALIGALLNLVNNAVQATQGHIGLNTDSASKQRKLKVSFIRTAINGEAAVAIAIADNGPGMTQEQLNSAKEIFFTTKPQGTGLGLTIVQSVARAHGGYFKLQSQQGRGTCGILTLPLLETFSSEH